MKEKQPIKTLAIIYCVSVIALALALASLIFSVLFSVSLIKGSIRDVNTELMKMNEETSSFRALVEERLPPKNEASQSLQLKNVPSLTSSIQKPSNSDSLIAEDP